MRAVIPISILTYALVLACGGAGGGVSTTADALLAPYLDRRLAWECGDLQETLTIGRTGQFHWTAQRVDGEEEITGTWTARGLDGIGLTVDVEGTSDGEAWSGRVDIAPVRTLPRATFIHETDRWGGSCTVSLDPAALFDAAVATDAVALRGDLGGVFR